MRRGKGEIKFHRVHHTIAPTPRHQLSIGTHGSPASWKPAGWPDRIYGWQLVPTPDPVRLYAVLYNFKLQEHLLVPPSSFSLLRAHSCMKNDCQISVSLEINIGRSSSSSYSSGHTSATSRQYVCKSRFRRRSRSQMHRGVHGKQPASCLKRLPGSWSRLKCTYVDGITASRWAHSIFLDLLGSLNVVVPLSCGLPLRQIVPPFWIFYRLRPSIK